MPAVSLSSSSAVTSHISWTSDTLPATVTTDPAGPSMSNTHSAGPSTTHSTEVSSPTIASSSARTPPVGPGDMSTKDSSTPTIIHDSSSLPFSSSPEQITSVPPHASGPRLAEPVTTILPSTASSRIPSHAQAPTPIAPVTTAPSTAESLPSSTLSSSLNQPSASSPPSDSDGAPTSTSTQDPPAPTQDSSTSISTSTTSGRTLRIIADPTTIPGVVSSTTTQAEIGPPISVGLASSTPILLSSVAFDPKAPASDRSSLAPPTIASSSNADSSQTPSGTTIPESSAVDTPNPTAVFWPAPGSDGSGGSLMPTTAIQTSAGAGNGPLTASVSPLSSMATMTDVTPQSNATRPTDGRTDAPDAGAIAGICVGVVCGLGLTVALFKLLRARRKKSASATLFSRDRGCGESVANLRLSSEAPTNTDCSERGSYHTTLDVRMSSGTYDFPLPPSHALKATDSRTLFIPSPDPFRASHMVSSISRESTLLPSSTFMDAKVVPDEWESAWNLPRPSSELMRRTDIS